MLKTETIDTTCMGCFEQLKSVGGICPNCGYNEAAQIIPPHQLRPRTILNGKYLLGKVLGEGGFGITYIGWDLNLDIKVAIKEYYPTGFVTRENTTTNTVQPYTGSQGDFFAKGRERFVDEAKRLAKFRSMPGIVTVNDFFIENGTAYIAMEYIEGQTLKSYLTQMGGKLPAAQVFDMLRPVMTSLAQVHKSGMIHRDISPDNIMISKEGYVKLLDFGAAREFAESGNRRLSIMLKPGFAPEEQYRSRGVQGPWTDIYALCATMYKAITGVTPDESSERMRRDEIKRPSELGVAMPSAQAAVLMKGMAVLQEDRWQSIDEMMAAMKGLGIHATEYMSRDGGDSRLQEAENRLLEKEKQLLEREKRLLEREQRQQMEQPHHEIQQQQMAQRQYEIEQPQHEIERRHQEIGKEVTDNRNHAIRVNTPSLLPTNLRVGQRNLPFGKHTWRVLDIRKGQVLLLSEEIIEKRKYQNKFRNITWKDCDLRQYLNGSFLQSFAKTEQTAIIEVFNVNSNNQWYGTKGGDNTAEKIFLLSIDEVLLYFGDSGQVIDRPGGAYYIRDQYGDARKAKYRDDWSWWWLRSPGLNTISAACVDYDGDLGMHGYGVLNESGGVRPALWLHQ
jgi:serine/threonine protein kinase